MPDANIQTPQWLSQMENILEELNEGVAIADDHLRVIFANEALVRLWQYDRAEILGRTPDAIFPAEDLPFIMRQHEWDLRYGRHRYEFYLPRKDGQKIPAIFSQAAKLPLPEMRKAIVDGVRAWRHGPLADDVSLVIAESR